MTRPDSGRIGVAAVAAVAVVALVALAVVATLLFKSAAPDARPIASGAGAPAETRQSPDGTGATPIAPRPYSESEPAGLEIEVVRPDGKLATQARLVLHRGERVLGSGTTDERGIAGFDPGVGQAGLLVLPNGAPAHVTSVSLATGRRRIQLPAGVSITGRVEVNGETPREPIALDCSCQDPEDDVPTNAAIWTALEGDFSPKCTTAAGGAFEMVGVREGSEWSFSGPLGYRLDGLTAGGKEVFRVAAPATGVLMRLARIPIIRGRVVLEGQRVPIPHAECEVVFRSETDASGLHMETDDDGRFRCTAQHLDRAVALAKIEITVRGTNRTGERRLVLDPAPERDIDVGDLEVPGGKKIAISVHDPAGAPIEGAFSRVGDAADLGSRTDAAGRGVVTAAPGAKSFFIGALRHDVVLVPIPDVLPDLVPVTLRPDCGLEIHVKTPAGTSPTSLRVRLSAATSKIFVNGAMGNDAVQIAGGATENGYGAWGGAAFVHFTPDVKGQVVVAGLVAGVQLEVELRDALDGVLASEDVTLGPAEWKAIDLAVTTAPRSLSGRVHDVDGQPVEGAGVIIDADSKTIASRSFSSGDDHRMRTTTDADGKFLLSGIFQDSVSLAIDKPGFAPWIRRDFPLPAEDAVLDVTLKKGCALTVEIYQAEGDPIPGLSVRVSISDSPGVNGASKKPGVYFFADLPVDSPATITTYWADRMWTRRVLVAGDQTERITMPLMGKIVLDWSSLNSPPFVVLLAPATGGDAPIQRLFGRGPHGRVPPSDLTISPVVPGDYTVTFDAGSHLRAESALPEHLTVRPGETTRIVLRKP